MEYIDHIMLMNELKQKTKGIQVLLDKPQESFSHIGVLLHTSRKTKKKEIYWGLFRYPSEKPTYLETLRNQILYIKQVVGIIIRDKFEYKSQKTLSK